jgi:hypothetical protein
MSECGVCIGSGDYEGYCEFFQSDVRKARKEHRCCECNRVITRGANYVAVRGKYEGDFWSETLCCDCDEIGSAFACDGGRLYCQLWEDMEYVFDKLTTACFDRLQTPSAKAYLRKRWMDWKGLVE